MFKVFGVIDKNINKPVYQYSGERIRLKRPYNNPEHVHFEVIDGNYLNGYSWDGTQVIYDTNYTPPETAVEIVVKEKIENAIIFYNNLMVDFATENVLMGITQLGKTKEVADYLQNVMRYGQSGSLYEVINEVDSLILAGIPVGLSPFVTEQRLNDMKAQVSAYLQG